MFILPDETWARRVSGVYSNDLANASPARAHAVLTERPDGTYLVSVRAPLENKQGADELCRQFPTGGGRAAAAGINALPGDQLHAFIDAHWRLRIVSFKSAASDARPETVVQEIQYALRTRLEVTELEAVVDEQERSAMHCGPR